MTDIEGFRKAHVGKNVQYKVRPSGSFEEWKIFEGILTEEGVIVHKGGRDTLHRLPDDEYEYAAIRVVGHDGSISFLDPSPAASRAQSRAASLERAAISDNVSRTAEQGASERRIIAEMIAQMRESSAAERRLLLDEQRAAAANAALERQQMQQILLQVADATSKLQAAIGTQNAHQQPPQSARTATTAALDETTPTTIGRRLESDIFFPNRWDLSTADGVRMKRLEVQQMFAITATSSPYRWRAFNQLSAWMDAAFEQPSWSEAFANVGVTAMENLRAVVAQEDQKINARSLFTATSSLPSDKMGDAISALAKETEKQQRGRSRGRGGYGHGAQSNSNNQRQQGNSRGPAQQ